MLGGRCAQVRESVQLQVTPDWEGGRAPVLHAGFERDARGACLVAKARVHTHTHTKRVQVPRRQAEKRDKQQRCSERLACNWLPAGKRKPDRQEYRCLSISLTVVSPTEVASTRSVAPLASLRVGWLFSDLGGRSHDMSCRGESSWNLLPPYKNVPCGVPCCAVLGSALVCCPAMTYRLLSTCCAR